MNIVIENKNVLSVDGKIIKKVIGSEIEKFIRSNNYIYILLYFPKGHNEQDTNIWKIDLHGNIIWKITKFGNDEVGAAPYIELNQVNGKLIASNWKGVDFFVDVKTGQIEAIKKGERPW
jgi:hypothetical protein